MSVLLGGSLSLQDQNTAQPPVGPDVSLGTLWHISTQYLVCSRGDDECVSREQQNLLGHLQQELQVRHTRATGTLLNWCSWHWGKGRGRRGSWPSCPPAGSLDLGRCHHTARLSLDRDADSEELPPSSVLSGWFVLGVVSQP